MDFEEIDAMLATAADDRQRWRAAALLRQAKSRAMYSNDAGEPILRPSFAVFVDSLGTKQRAAALDDAGLRQDIEAFRNAQVFIHDEVAGDQDELGVRFLAFTDNIVLGMPLGNDDTAGFGLGYIVSSVEMYQTAVALAGRQVRGGITLGPLYMDSQMAHGKALVDAVQLEEKKAAFPRIVLSTKCLIPILEDIRRSYGGDIRNSLWAESLLVDTDDRIFINYLSALFGENEDELPGRLTEIGSGLADSLGEFHSEPKIYAKYEWAAQYFNHFCRHTSGIDAGALELRDPAGDPIPDRAFAWLDNESVARSIQAHPETD